VSKVISSCAIASAIYTPSLSPYLPVTPQASPEMCSLNMGSMNFNISRASDRIKEWKFGWKQPYLARTDDHIFRNPSRDIERIVAKMGGGRVKF